MKLKRNLLTILYTVPFLFVTGFGLFQMTNLIVSTVPNKYLVTSIIVFGLIIYLIVAFFIKEADTLRLIQTKRASMILLECMVFLVCGGLFFYIRWMDESMAPAVIFTLLLLSLCAVARFCGGRLCGILCAGVSFYMLSTLAATDLISTQSAIDMLCFFLPFAVFLGIMRILIPKLGNSGFILMVAYLVLGFVFSLALALNPFVCVLLLGCVLSLFFSSSDQPGKSIWTRGILSAALLVVFTIFFVVCIRFMIPDILGMPNWNLDRNLPLEFSVDTLAYILNKYANPVTYLHLHFPYGILPALMFFFSFLAGYYTIRKKSSYMGPLILSQVVLFVYYIVFCEGGSQFYYLYYMLPVFTCYGFSNTLLLDEPEQQEELSRTEESAPALGMEPSEKPEPEPISEPEPQPEPEPEATLTPEEGPILEVKEKKKKDKKQEKAEKVELPTEDVPAAPKKGEIPEWTIPAEFLPENQDLEVFTPQGEETVPEALEENLIEEETLNTSAVDDSLDLDLFVPDETTPVSDEATLPEPEQMPEENTETLSSGQEDLSVDNLIQVEEPDQVAAIVHDGSNDMEQFISTGAVDHEDSLLEFSDDVTEVGQIQEESQEEEADIRDERAEETKLNNLLDRLDMSEPIKRMNESAKEDMADVIEREEEQVELSEALPLKPSKSALPKYKKPNFDFEREPLSIPLDDQFSTISEYDEVPTVHDLENQWNNDSKPVIETVATKVEEPQPNVQEEIKEPVIEQKEEPESVHSEQIVRKNGMGKRSYHKITIR